MNSLRGNIILVLSFLGLSRSVFGNPAPTLPDPGTGNPTAYTTISSDFGPRNTDTAGATNPHGGIDYEIATGGRGHAVAEGNITAIDQPGPNALIQIANNWEYIHMEYAGPHVTAVAHDGGAVLVFRNGIDQPIEKVLGTRRTPPAVWPTYEGFPVITFVSTSAWIYSVRTNHLHLEYRNGLENPLKHVVHDYSKDPLITPRYKYIDSEALAQNFTGNAIYNYGDRTVILQAGVDVRANKDLNSIEILVKSLDATAYIPLNKWIYEPANTPGLVNTTTGRGRTIYKKDTEPEIATAIDEGIYPLKEITSFDFFKFKWDTKENSSGTGPALANSDAKWPDGSYYVKMEAMDIIGYPDSGAKKEEQKILDNFRPSLERVEIKNTDDEQKYLHTWDLQDGALKKTGPAPNEALGAGAYTINIRFSEPVAGVKVYLDAAIEDNLLPLETSDPAGNQKNFTASLTAEKIASLQDGIHSAIITAADLAGTSLLFLPADKTTINSSEITRNNSSGFFPENAGAASVITGLVNCPNPPLPFRQISECRKIRRIIIMANIIKKIMQKIIRSSGGGGFFVPDFKAANNTVWRAI